MNGGNVGGPSACPVTSREAAHGLGQGPEARSVTRGAAPAVAADVEHHQARVPGVDRLVVDAPAGEGTGAVADDQHVSAVQELVEEVLALGLTEVEGDTSLVPADTLPHQADAVLAVPPSAERVAGARLLDLDDLGTELTQRGGDHRSGHQRGRVDHPQPGQGAGHLSHERHTRAGPVRGSRAGWSPGSGPGILRGAGVRGRRGVRRPRRRQASGWRRRRTRHRRRW